MVRRDSKTINENILVTPHVFGCAGSNENVILTLIIEHLYVFFFLSQGNLLIVKDYVQLLYTIPSSIAHSHSASTALV